MFFYFWIHVKMRALLYHFLMQWQILQQFREVASLQEAHDLKQHPAS